MTLGFVRLVSCMNWGLYEFGFVWPGMSMAWHLHDLIYVRIGVCIKLGVV